MSKKNYACPVCAASMNKTCRLCGYTEKNTMMYYFTPSLSTTESKYNRTEVRTMQNQSEEQNSKEEFPRDFDLDFVDPHDDICRRMAENED